MQIYVVMMWILYIQAGESVELLLLFQDTTYRHFKTLRLRPELFTSHLTDSVGFSSYRLLTHTGTHSELSLVQAH